MPDVEVQTSKRRWLSLKCSHFLTNWDRRLRFPPCERGNALVFIPHIVFVIIFSGWAGNDVNARLKISFFSYFHVFSLSPFIGGFTKIPQGDLFPPIFPGILMPLGTYIQRFREGYCLTVRTSYIQWVRDFGKHIVIIFWMNLCEFNFTKHWIAFITIRTILHHE